MTEMILNEMILWLNKKPNWIIESINKVLETKLKLNSEDIKNATEKCVIESASVKIKTTIKDDIFKAYFGSKSTLNNLKFKSISNIKGINNLNPSTPLDLGSDNLTIVYGRNGSGKSGYTRILKNACGARKAENILCDVFKEATDQECDIEYIKDGQTHKIIWSPIDSVNSDLSNVDIFDSSCGISYIIEANEVTYEPKLLKFLSYLIEISGKVNENIISESEKLTNKIPEIEITLINTLVANDLKTFKTSKEFANKYSRIKWSSTKEKKLNELTNQLLNSNNETYINALKNQLINRTQIASKIKENNGVLKQSILTDVLKLKKNIKNNEININKSTAILKGQKIKGISTELWKKMWDSAKEFSEKEAYPNISFPNTEADSKCVLCQQNLSKESIKRFTSLDKFIKNKFNTELEINTQKLELLYKKLEVPANQVLIENILLNAQFEADVELRIKKHFENQYERGVSFKTANSAVELLKISDTRLLKKIESDARVLSIKIDKYSNSKTSQGVKTLNEKINDLKAEKWLVKNYSQIYEGFKTIEKKERFAKAKNNCLTTSYSTKKSELAEKLITEVFLERFDKEIKELGGEDLKVKISKNGTVKGRVKYAIKLKDNIINEKIENVLSEGEFRIVSLAAFLADVAEKPNNSPFVFDDPISSLDADYEENCVERIIKLSKERQVIVFTHRLSFLGLLNESAKKDNIIVNNITLVSESWGKGQPSKSFLDNQSVDSAIKNLKNERIPQAKKAEVEIGIQEYSIRIKAITSDFRILIERLIEDVLIDKIIVRHRRGIQTQNRMNTLAKITKTDVELIEYMMSKYSTYEHSQSSEIPSKPLKSEEIVEDFDKVLNWITEFKSRR